MKNNDDMLDDYSDLMRRQTPRPNRFAIIATSIVEHGLVRKGLAEPSRVWHIDEQTGKRTLVIDNSTLSSQAEAVSARSEKRRASNLEPGE
jgi:hypothetical protein